MQFSRGRDSQSGEHSGQDGTGHMHGCGKKGQAERVKSIRMPGVCLHNPGSWGLGGVGAGDWEELREEGLALEGRKARSLGR